MEYGLIGEKLKHSYSPMIHARLADYRYTLKEIAPEALEAFLTARDFKGLNVTIPYKKAVMPYCAELTEAAREVGCVNTLLVRADGTLLGHNTDIGGFIEMLRSAGIQTKGKKVAVLGSGGTSLTATAALKRLGAGEILAVSRSGPVDYESLYRAHSDVEILVNTTPVGMYPNNGQSPVDLSRLPKLEGVADVVYNPERTALILDAQQRGIPAVSGLAMLVAQARGAAELFLGHAIAEEKDAEIRLEIRKATANLILIGMPGSGKSSVGQRIAQALGRTFVDCDARIVARAGMSIPEIFSLHGEAYFRELEAQALSDACRESGCVIATGGGVVLREDNIRAMRQNGRIALLRRPIESLPRDGRPLSASREAVQALWMQRKALYAAAADFTIENTGTIEQAVQATLEGFYEAARH